MCGLTLGYHCMWCTGVWTPTGIPVRVEYWCVDSHWDTSACGVLVCGLSLIVSKLACSVMLLLVGCGLVFPWAAVVFFRRINIMYHSCRIAI